MPMRAKRDRTQQIAECACDDCGTTVTMPAKHARPGRVIGEAGRPVMRLLNTGDVVTKLQKKGWSYTNKGLLCAECSAAKVRAKTPKPQQKETVIVTQLPKTDDPAVRQPTREQRRQIVELLNTCYDTKAERYIGTDTDKTVADCIGGGVLFGWVAQVREEFFGPDGGNAEMAELLQSIAYQRTLVESVAEKITDIQKQVATYWELHQSVVNELTALERRVVAIKIAVGPKAGK